jgi:hypothetical protein
MQPLRHFKTVLRAEAASISPRPTLGNSSPPGGGISLFRRRGHSFSGDGPSFQSGRPERLCLSRSGKAYLSYA